MYDNVNKLAFSLDLKVAPGWHRKLEKQKSRPDRRES
jgi:hypothetical protein